MVVEVVVVVIVVTYSTDLSTLQVFRSVLVMSSVNLTISSEGEETTLAHSTPWTKLGGYEEIRSLLLDQSRKNLEQSQH